MAEGDQRAKPDRAQERAAARAQEATSEEPPEEVRYTVEQLSESTPQLLGVSRAALAGALHGESRKSFTLDEAKALVDDFLKRPEASD